MQEVLRHRDVAVLIAVEALEEASAAERLIKCLRYRANVCLCRFLPHTYYILAIWNGEEHKKQRIASKFCMLIK